MRSENVISAAALVLPPGVFMTMMPRAVAASKLMLSTPVPARPMNLRFFAALITSGVTCANANQNKLLA